MFARLIQISLSQRFLVLTVLAGIIIGGVLSWISLKIEAYPDVSDTEVAVITVFPGRPAEEVEQMVTIPLERELNAVPQVIARRSRTIFGLSIIRLTFEEGVDDYFARQRVLERVGTTQLPDGAEVQLGPLSTPVGEVLRYVVEGNNDPMILRDKQDWVIVPALLKAHGIADITSFGGLVKQYQIIINPSSLDRLQVTIQDIYEAVMANNASTGGGVIHFGSSMMAIRSTGRIQSREDIERIVISMNGGIPILIRDVARVEIGNRPQSGIFGYRLADGTEVHSGVEGIVLMRRGENPGEVLESVKSIISQLNEEMKPEGIQIRTVYDRQDLVDSTLHTVGKTLLEGIIIVILVLIFFLGNLRAALIVGMTIPLSLLIAFIMMKLTGIPANLLSMGAIDFGIIVDASVIMIEAIARMLHANPPRNVTHLIEIVHKATSQVQRQIVFSIAIIILAFLPLFTLQRVEGKLFTPMAYTLSFAIGGSLFLAISAVPVFSTFFFRSGFHEWHNKILDRIEAAYSRSIVRIIANARQVVFMATGSVILALISGLFLGSEFLPELDEGGFNIRCVLPAGVSLDTADQYPPIIRKTIGEHPEVKTVLTQLGRNDDGTDPYGPNRIEALVQLQPYSTWKSGLKKKDLLLQMKAELENKIPGASFSFSQPILDNVTEAVTGSAADLAILLNGQDLTELRYYADQILQVIRSVPGSSEAAIEQEGPQTQLVVEVDREALARYGINILEVNRIIEMAVGGSAFSTLYEGDKRYDIALRFTREERDSVFAIQNLTLITRTGLRIPLNTVANVELKDGQSIIAREGGQRQVIIRTNIRGRDQGGFVVDAQKAVARNITLPSHIGMRWGGQYENLTRARARLMLVIPITVGVIFAVLYFLFDRNMRYAAITLLNVPFALIGGILVLHLRNINFSVSAGVGFVSLFGVAVMSGVLLVSHINMLRFERGMPLTEAVIEGARTQFRPVSMMMIVALIGLIPASMASGIGSDIQRPLASVIVGGLISALILTLTAMPAVYYLLEQRKAEKP